MSKLHFSCPVCGSSIKSKTSPEFLINLQNTTHLESDILDKLILNYPNKTSKKDLLDYVYAFRKTPQSNSFVALISKLKSKIKVCGWNIINTEKMGRGNQAKYVLRKITK